VVAAAANLRARCYGIEEVDVPTARLIAGRIVPAIATTTALVTGFVCLELYKIVQRKPLAAYRNVFANQATALMLYIEPTPCPSHTAPLRPGALFVPPGVDASTVGACALACAGWRFLCTRARPPSPAALGSTDTSVARTWSWTMWDSLRFRAPLTLGALLDWVQTQLGLTASMVMFGSAMLYSDMIGNPAKQAAKRSQDLLALALAVTPDAVPAGTTELQLEVLCVDDDDNDVEIPSVKYALV
jgi:ubiquitin-activating enzyme E1